MNASQSRVSLPRCRVTVSVPFEVSIGLYASYALPRLWSQLTASLPFSLGLSLTHLFSLYMCPSVTYSPSVDSPLSLSVTPSLFHSRLKNCPLQTFAITERLSSSRLPLVYRFFRAIIFLAFFVKFCFFSFLHWTKPAISFWAHVNILWYPVILKNNSVKTKSF